MTNLRTVTVPTEDGRKCVVTFSRHTGWWVVTISDELIAMQPEAIHAVLGHAVMQMREEIS